MWENSAQTMQQLYKQCRKSNRNSIEFSLSNADKGAVGLILALELASLTQLTTCVKTLDLTVEYVFQLKAYI